MPVIVEQVWTQSIEEVGSRLQTNLESGLSELESKRRLLFYGRNIQSIQKKDSLLILFFRQFVSPLVGVLVVAAGLAFSFGEWLEGIAIIAVLLINAVIGFVMEWQAVRSMEALRNLAQTKARLIRDGKQKIIKSAGIVPGDLIYFEPGDIVTADCRVVEQINLGVKEAALTGESNLVKKQTEPLPVGTLLADRKNQLFKGTTIARGNGKGIVTATGTSTELGRITNLAQEADKTATPLEKRLGVLAQKLLWLTLFLTLFIFLLGVIQGKDLYLMVKTAIALGIAAIPEGLPIVATIALARGMLRLAKHRVIVKKLSAVETLGQTNVIFTDKTGTLTENQLSVGKLIFNEVSASVYFDKNELKFEIPEQQKLPGTTFFKQLRKIAALCNNAEWNPEEKDSEFIGDPLEVACLEFVETAQGSLNNIRRDYPRVNEIPFDSTSKMMGTLHENKDHENYLVCIKGAVEVVLKESDFVLTSKGKKPFQNKQKWIEKSDHLAANGLRTLAFAYSEINEPEDQFFHNVTLVGVIGFLDPPRKEVKKSIHECKTAGIRVVMVTGDHPETASNIAREIGMTEKGQINAIHGKDLLFSVAEGQENFENLMKTDVFARVDPEQKLKLISLYQEKGFVVGMTGDGINDTPALKKADIGIAMGNRGTEAAKEVADLVLEDDSFESIVLAIRQGRGIFQNIQYFVVYLLSCNLSELLIVALAALASLAMPLMPLQILFLNMVTDVFPALALGMNREASDVMEKPPRNTKDPIIGAQSWKSIIVYALSMTIAVTGVLHLSIYYFEMIGVMANNLTFYTLILAQLWNVFNLPGRNQSFFKNVVTTNIHIWLSLLTCIVITCIAYFIPVTREILHLQTIDWDYFWIILPFSLLPVVLVQIVKRLGWVE